VGAAVIALAAALGYLLSRRTEESPWKNATFTRLTSLPSEELYPSLSPDGKSLVYQSRASGNWDNYYETETADITWTVSPDGKTVHTKLSNGKAEIKMSRFAGTNPDRPLQINNLTYRKGAAWNSPFDLYFSDHYYKGFGKSWELKEANGYMITVEVTSDGKRIPRAVKKSD
jgi:hypothetical protein